MAASKKNKALSPTLLQKELQNLVSQQVIPAQLADKLGKKLTEKKVQLTKDQLQRLVEKIMSYLGTAAPVMPVKQPARQPLTASSQDMKSLIDEIEQLKDRINELEESSTLPEEEVTGKMVTTEDVASDSFKGVDTFHPLQKIPNDAQSIIILMKWLQHLVDHVGKKFLADVLSYYVDINWITEDVRFSILEYSDGIDERQIEEGNQKENCNLPTKEHIQSLVFIQKLKGSQIDDRFMSKIDREMEKIQKSLNLRYKK